MTTEYQLRIYTVKPGAMDAWTAEWRDRVAPLRRRLGFEILGPWIVSGEDKFVWILGYAGAEGFEAADAAYYRSPERAEISPDPARHLLSTEHCLMFPR